MITENLEKNLDSFMMRDEGPGFPFFLPKGMVLKNALFGLLERDSQKRRICGDFHSDHVKPSALGDIRTLGSLQRKYVYNCDR